MSTLTEPALWNLIDRLFAEADAAQKARFPAMGGIDRSDYRKYYTRLRDQPLPVSRDTGKLLYMLARAVRARSIVEFGTSFGISTLHLAAALRDNGGGRLIGSEFEPSKIKRARENLAAGGLSDLVDIRDNIMTRVPELVDAVCTQIQGAVREDPNRTSSTEDFQSDCAAVRQAVIDRIAATTTILGR